MGQLPPSCHGSDFAVDLATHFVESSDTRRQEPLPPDAACLLQGVPRELAEALRATRQLTTLRRRPWLSPAAFWGLQKGLQKCDLRRLAERYIEADELEDCNYEPPIRIPWNELTLDHIMSAGQVFSLAEASHDRYYRMKRTGFTALRQGKVGVVLLAGGANLRLGMSAPPAACHPEVLQLHSGKSLLQLLFERIRRVVTLSLTHDVPETSAAAKQPYPSVPVFIMTSRLTHQHVIEHLQSNRYFGLPSRDVFIFEQPTFPVLDEFGELLSQSVGGSFAQLPAGPGHVLKTLVYSSALEQFCDRGTEMLHILGTENLLARVCDPVFLGFCREMELDCACKITSRIDPTEEMELFCVQQSPVNSAYADVEDAAIGLSPADAPPDVLDGVNEKGALRYKGSINSFFMTVAYIQDVVGRPVRERKVQRVLPFLDFYFEHKPSEEEATFNGEPPVVPSQRRATRIQPGGWGIEASSTHDADCQTALLAAAARLSEHCGACGLTSSTYGAASAFACDVRLDFSEAVPVIEPILRSVTKLNPLQQRRSLRGHLGAHWAMEAEQMCLPLLCSLVVPTAPNACVLETSVMDYFAFTDRAVALEVARNQEYAPINERSGSHSAEAARSALHKLHCCWLLTVGDSSLSSDDFDAGVEVSPLLSYDGEGLDTFRPEQAVEKQTLPCHLRSAEELESTDPEDPSRFDGADVAEETTAEAALQDLDTRLFYLQEYPQRLKMSCSLSPRFAPHLSPGNAKMFGAARG
eukprot:TRINITY_DN14121_c0_g1_i1.p1 TRINITY_DN14121_c0_g1~~TRINITY_DN14121_c0_g1_i1.p1  ORF type:complete len:753 (+),score=168.49 TRINITY_DN14121_c0_g1_i1:103-2361(+)